MIASTATTIQLQWDSAFQDGGSPITEYQIYYDEIEGVGVANIENWMLAANGDFLTYTVTGLTSLKGYFFRVRAKSDAYIAGDFSPISKYYASPIPPTPAFDTSLTTTNQTEINLFWTAPTVPATTLPILGYKIYWNLGFKTSQFALLYEIPNSDAVNQLVTQLKSGRTYSFQISSYNLVGESALSSFLTLNAQSSPKNMDAPILIESLRTGSTTASIEFRWRPPVESGGVPIKGYKLYQVRESTQAMTVAYDGSSDATVTSYKVINLVLNELYSFYLTALNPLESETSPSITLIAAGLPDAPSSIMKIAGSQS
jgi:hypothetical protein